MDVASTSTSKSFIAECDVTKDVCFEEKESTIPVKHFLITWTIDGFLKLTDFRDKSISSPPIQIGCSDSVTLVVSPYFLFRNDKNVQFCLLRNASSDKSTVQVTYRFGIKKSKVTWFQGKVKVDFPCNGTDLILYDILEYFENQQVLSENSLIVLCELYITYNEDIDKLCMTKISVSASDLLDLSVDYLKLIRRVENSDASVQVKDLKIPVHKAMLAARSPVFARLFSHNKSCLTVKEEDYYHIHNILIYIYTANFYYIASNGVSIGLYECAKRYKIQGLIQLLTPIEINVSSLMKEESIDFTWKINKFSSLKVKPDECITSPPFHAGSKIAPLWYLDMYPEGNHRSYNSIGIFLRTNDRIFLKTNGSTEFLDLRTHISILDDLNQERYSKYTDKPVYPDYIFGFPDYISKMELNEAGLLKGDKLIINCKLNILFSIEIYDKISLVSQAAYDEYACLERLSADMEHLVLDGGFSDCTLVVSDIVMFPIHKPIISTRCAALDLIIKAADSDVVKVEDVTADVLEEIISFIYSGKMKSYNIYFCLKLYEGAKVYKMTTLTTRCITDLLFKLDEKSLCDVLLCAYKHEETSLFLRCLMYLWMNRDKILNSVEWQHFVNKEPGLASLIYKWLESPSNIPLFPEGP